MVEVFWCVTIRKIAPALESPVGARFGEHELSVEHQTAAADSARIDERTHIQDAFAAGNLAANDPVERAAPDEFGGALWHHAGRVDVLRRLTPFLLLPHLPPDPVLEVV